MTSPPIALLFEGQGGQRPGMGFPHMAECRLCGDLTELAGDISGLPLRKLMLEGPEETIRRTEVAQPLLLTLAVSQGLHLMREGLQPTAVLGHSLGHYSALVVSGALAFSDALKLVIERARLMQATVPEGVGAMAAIGGMADEDLQALCDETAGEVGIACFNAPGRHVISGERSAVELAAERCMAEGAGAEPIPASVPFHSNLLAPMVEPFAALVAATPFGWPSVPVIDNVRSALLCEPEGIRESLVSHVQSAVRFEAGLRCLAAMKVSRFVHCGPGQALRAFVRRTVAGAESASFEEQLALLQPQPVREVAVAGYA